MGYPKPNYTQTPNVLFEEQMKDMSEAELKITLCAIRKTFGWHKNHDAISLSQFQKMTGLSRQGVLDGIERAIERGIIRKVGEGKRGVGIYEVVIEDDSQDNGLVNNLDQSTELTRTSQKSRLELVKDLDTQKKGKKTKEKEKATPPPSPDLTPMQIVMSQLRDEGILATPNDFKQFKADYEDYEHTAWLEGIKVTLERRNQSGTYKGYRYTLSVVQGVTAERKQEKAINKNKVTQENLDIQPEGDAVKRWSLDGVQLGGTQ